MFCLVATVTRFSQTVERPCKAARRSVQNRFGRFATVLHSWSCLRAALQCNGPVSLSLVETLRRQVQL